MSGEILQEKANNYIFKVGILCLFNPLLWAAFSPICLSHKELRQAYVSVSVTHFITVLKEKPWVSLLINSLQLAKARR